MTAPTPTPASSPTAAYENVRHPASFDAEANRRRIAAVENGFGASGQPLQLPGRMLVGEGLLTKACRKKLKPRQFFLFNDLLVYGNIILGTKKYNKQRIMPLEEIKLQPVEDEGAFRNGWLICTKHKSFAVYAATPAEKRQWMGHIGKCVQEVLARGGKKAADEHAAVWVPDTEARVCMGCNQSQFGIVKRRHHCRKCGAVVCSACSSNKWLLKSQSRKPLRVCDQCYHILLRGGGGQDCSTTIATDAAADGRPELSQNVKAPARKKRQQQQQQQQQGESKEQEVILVKQSTPAAFDSRPLQPEKTSSVAAAEAQVPIAPQPQPQPPPRPPMPKLFTSIDDPADPIHLPEAPTEDPDVQISQRNPKLYELLNMSQESSSFWWDSVEATTEDSFFYDHDQGRRDDDGDRTNEVNFAAKFDETVSLRVVQEKSDVEEEEQSSYSSSNSDTGEEGEIDSSPGTIEPGAEVKDDERKRCGKLAEQEKERGTVV